jgi:PAS domain S-box-containing protein
MTLPPCFRRFTLLAAALLAVPVLHALDPLEKPADYNARHWDTEDGLPHNSVRELFQTRDGYLWIGTNFGLARFDGLTFTVFTKHNTPELRSPQVTSMAETADGSLWIGTASGLLRYHEGRFTRFDKSNGLRGDTINAVCVAPDGSLWIGSREGVVRWVNGSFVRDIDTSGHDLIGIRDINVDAKGVIWISHGTGLLRYHQGRLTPFGSAQGLASQQILAVASDATGRTIVISQNGLFRLEDEKFIALPENPALSSQRIGRALADRAGNLWVGSTGGLDRVHGGRVAPYANRQGQKFGVVDAVLEDREGCLWVGTSGGLYRLTDRRAYSLSQADGIIGSLVNTVTASRDGSLWISTWNGGVTHLHNGGATKLTRGAPLSHDTVSAIYEDPEGTVWFGNRGSSLDRLQDGKVTTFVYQSGVATARPVTSILMNDDGTLLLGIASRGLLQLKDGVIDIVPGAEALNTARHTVWKIHRTANGRVLLATTNGIYERRADNVWSLVTLPGLGSNVAVRDLLEVNGTLWLATDGHGLVRWQGDEVRAYREAVGMLDDSLFNVLDDGLGALWVASARGIARVRKADLSALDRGASTQMHLMTIGRNDGLLSASASGSGTPSATRAADGRLLFATDQGVAVVDPRILQVNAQPPTVVVERLFADDRVVPLHATPILGADTTRLEFNFTALSLVAPQRLRFRYHLEGSDHGWVDAGSNRNATYTHLAPGRYTFRVTACNNDGVWNEAGSSIAFTILPHFYQTLWFRLAAVFALGGLAALALWLRDRQMRHQQAALGQMNAELDLRVQQRTAELANSLTLLKEAQETAANEQARLKFIFEAVPVGISLYSRRLDGTQLRLANDAHLQICGLTRAQAAEMGIFKRISHPEDYARQEELNARLEAGEVKEFSMEKRYLRPDGKIAWVIFTRLRFQHPDGNVEYLTTVVDITASKQAERDLAETNRHLVEVSRTAGMAEVATGVLHNVGNVLNSLNVSSTLIATGLRASKADSLARLSELLQAHSNDLAGFLTTDPKGRRVPELIASLAAHSLAERDRLLAEAASLQQNVDHIRDIVTMQQTYATAASMAEPLDASRLMEDALRMNKGTLQNHAVRVERAFQACAPVFAEKAKVLQILINLVGNAKHACTEGGAGDKIITLGVEPAGDRVRLTVKDNGIGIAPENLTRIFAHGFTTKATGHGFGLHSSANAAKEMKGSLTAASAGPGLGATFILELPLARPAASAVSLVDLEPAGRS